MDCYNEKFNTFFGITDVNNEKYITYKDVTKEEISVFIDAMENYEKNDYRAIHTYLDNHPKSANNISKFNERNCLLFGSSCADVFNNLRKIKYSHRMYDKMSPNLQKKYDRFDMFYLYQSHTASQKDTDMCENALRKYGYWADMYGNGLAKNHVNNVFNLEMMWIHIKQSEKCYRNRHMVCMHTCYHNVWYIMHNNYICNACRRNKFNTEFAKYVERRHTRLCKLCMVVLHDALNENCVTTNGERVLADAFLAWKMRLFL